MTQLSEINIEFLLFEVRDCKVKVAKERINLGDNKGERKRF